jgi:hypothetical protein
MQHERNNEQLAGSAPARLRTAAATFLDNCARRTDATHSGVAPSMRETFSRKDQTEVHDADRHRHDIQAIAVRRR